MANKDVRCAAQDASVRLWMVADRLGLTDSSFSRKLRFELPDEEKQKILKIIDELKGNS